MNVSEITTQLYAISRSLVEKTGEKPWIAPSLRIRDGKCEVALYRGYNDGKYTVGTAKGETPDAAIADAFAIIAALPDIEDAKLRDHMKRVTDTIDISPEAVEHLCAIHEGYEQHGTAATLRALSAALTQSRAETAAAFEAAAQYLENPTHQGIRPAWGMDIRALATPDQSSALAAIEAAAKAVQP